MDKSGLPLGVMETAEYNTFENNLQRGDKLLLYTDGLTEMRNKEREEFGLDRVEAILLEDKGVNSHTLIEDLKDKVSLFSKGTLQHDDLTLIAIEFRGEDVS